MIQKIAILFLGLIFFSQNVNANDLYSICKNAISTMQMMSCSQNVLKQYNNTLNKTYDDILRRLSSEKIIANFGGPKVVQKNKTKFTAIPKKLGKLPITLLRVHILLKHRWKRSEFNENWLRVVNHERSHS